MSEREKERDHIPCLYIIQSILPHMVGYATYRPFILVTKPSTSPIFFLHFTALSTLVTGASIDKPESARPPQTAVFNLLEPANERRVAEEESLQRHQELEAEEEDEEYDYYEDEDEDDDEDDYETSGDYLPQGMYVNKHAIALHYITLHVCQHMRLH